MHWNVRNRFMVAFVARGRGTARRVRRARLLAHGPGAARGGAAPDRGAGHRRAARSCASAWPRSASTSTTTPCGTASTRGPRRRRAGGSTTTSPTGCPPTATPTWSRCSTAGGSRWRTAATPSRRRSGPRELVQAARRGETGADLADLDGRLYVLAAAPVIAQTYPSRPAGVVVFGQAVTDAVLQSVNRFTGGQGRLAVYTDGGSRRRPARRRAARRPAAGAGAAAAGQAFTEGDFTSELVPLRDRQSKVDRGSSRSRCAATRSRPRSARSTPSPSAPS